MPYIGGWSACQARPLSFVTKPWQYHLRGSRTQGDVLHLSPHWTHLDLLASSCSVSVAGSIYVASAAACTNTPPGLPSSAMQGAPW